MFFEKTNVFKNFHKSTNNIIISKVDNELRLFRFFFIWVCFKHLQMLPCQVWNPIGDGWDTVGVPIGDRLCIGVRFGHKILDWTWLNMWMIFGINRCA